jgi:hypothetical protein
VTDLAEQSIRELSTELEAERALRIAADARVKELEADRKQLLDTLLVIEAKLNASSKKLSSFIDSVPPTASNRPVERWTHDVKGNKL